ncbi:MAG: hypothetical protein LBT03_00620 [Holosporales bacterium]|nr:hypothetical protein [Holosporales bacterium]
MILFALSCFRRCVAIAHDEDRAVAYMMPYQYTLSEKIENAIGDTDKTIMSGRLNALLVSDIV